MSVTSFSRSAHPPPKMKCTWYLKKLALRTGMARNVDLVIPFFLVALKCLTHAHLKQRIHPRVSKKMIGMEDLLSYNYRYGIPTMEQLRGCCKLSRHHQLSVAA